MPPRRTKRTQRSISTPRSRSGMLGTRFWQPTRSSQDTPTQQHRPAAEAGSSNNSNMLPMPAVAAAAASVASTISNPQQHPPLFPNIQQTIQEASASDISVGKRTQQPQGFMRPLSAIFWFIVSFKWKETPGGGVTRHKTSPSPSSQSSQNNYITRPVDDRW